MKTNALLFLFVAAMVVGCSPKYMPTTNTDYKKLENVPSRVVRLKKPLQGDKPTAQIRGTIQGMKIMEGQTTAEQLYNATLSFKEPGEEGMVKAGTKSGSDGAFELNVQPGFYDLEITLSGYNTLTVTNIDLEAGALYEMDFVLGQFGKKGEPTVVDFNELDVN